LCNQIGGANIMGLGGALFEAVEFENGRILNARFSRYRVPRFRDVPETQAVLLDRKDLPSSGAGETPLVGLAPALGNAIFDATGARLTSLPLAPPVLNAGDLSKRTEYLPKRHRQEFKVFGRIKSFLHTGDFYLTLRHAERWPKRSS
jgi:hypothetical protein